MPKWRKEDSSYRTQERLQRHRLNEEMRRETQRTAQEKARKRAQWVRLQQEKLRREMEPARRSNLPRTVYLSEYYTYDPRDDWDVEEHEPAGDVPQTELEENHWRALQVWPKLYETYRRIDRNAPNWEFKPHLLLQNEKRVQEGFNSNPFETITNAVHALGSATSQDELDAVLQEMQNDKQWKGVQSIYKMMREEFKSIDNAFELSDNDRELMGENPVMQWLTTLIFRSKPKIPGWNADWKEALQSAETVDEIIKWENTPLSRQGWEDLSQAIAHKKVWQLQQQINAGMTLAQIEHGNDVTTKWVTPRSWQVDELQNEADEDDRAWNLHNGEETDSSLEKDEL